MRFLFVSSSLKQSLRKHRVMTGRRSSAVGAVPHDVKLHGKSVLITGANTGIGYETALDLCRRGAKIIMACRDTVKAEDAKKKISEEVKDAEIIIKKLDLASLNSVRKFAEEVNGSEDRLDILINNAGVMMCPPWKTEDGFEMQLGVNHIGHFLLTNLLLDLLKKSAPSRIVIVSSVAYTRGKMNWEDIMWEKNYHSMYAYCSSKLANILHCRELSDRLEGTGVTCNVLHPGIVATDLGRHMSDLNHLPCLWRAIVALGWAIGRHTLHITPVEGAQTSIYCAVSPKLEGVSGKYFANCREKPLQRHALKKQDAEKLWALSEEWTSLKEE